MTCIVFGVYVFQFQKWTSVVSGLGESRVKSLLQITANPYGRLIGIGLLLILLGCGLFYILRTYPFRVLFKKVDLKGLVGIELFSAEEDTYFDKFLHRVLQLFDQANADAIIFEDLDRYDVTLIFEKLREISDLAYSREKLGLRQRKKPLRFFYLIRDDVFTASDRSKFFDFIIPVVPYVDASNSCDQLLQQFEEAGSSGLFSKLFLQDVSLYLGDMRLVSNIVNEFSVYRGRLSGSGLGPRSRTGSWPWSSIKISIPRISICSKKAMGMFTPFLSRKSNCWEAQRRALKINCRRFTTALTMPEWKY